MFCSFQFSVFVVMFVPLWYVMFVKYYFKFVNFLSPLIFIMSVKIQNLFVCSFYYYH